MRVVFDLAARQRSAGSSEAAAAGGELPSGAVGSLFGSTASVFFAMYLDAGGSRPFRATSAMLMTLSVAHSGALPAIGNGLLVGDRIHSGLREAAFQRVVCAALFLCGVRLLLQQCSRCARPGGINPGR